MLITRMTGQKLLAKIYHFISWNNPFRFPHAREAVVAVAAVCALIALVSMAAAKTGAGRRRGIAFSLLLFYLFALAGGTLLNRIPTASPKINLNLFWCAKYAWNHRSGIHWYYVMANMALFLPLGILVPWAWPKMGRLAAMALLGMLLSASIEITQYLTHSGLCELDDVFNNTWGTIMGYGCYRAAILWPSPARRRGWPIAASLLPLVGTLGLLAFLLWKNQPYWGGVF